VTNDIFRQYGLILFFFVKQLEVRLEILSMGPQEKVKNKEGRKKKGWKKKEGQKEARKERRKEQQEFDVYDMDVFLRWINPGKQIKIKIIFDIKMLKKIKAKREKKMKNKILLYFFK